MLPQQNGFIVRVSKHRLFLKLDHHGTKVNLYCLGKFLKDSSFGVIVGNPFTPSVQVSSEVAQGSILGSLLFIIFTTNLLLMRKLFKSI